MSDNPYQPPQCATKVLTGRPGVVIQRRFPLEVIANRTVLIDVDANEFTHQVCRAAETCGYAIVAQRDRQWTLRRGSLWHALYTFDVRKLPTTTTVALTTLGKMEIRLHCQSALTFSTPGDEERFERELDSLEAELLRGG
jgi:hypothetical protein